MTHTNPTPPPILPPTRSSKKVRIQEVSLNPPDSINKILTGVVKCRIPLTNCFSQGGLL